MTTVPVTSALSEARKVPVVEQGRLTTHCSEEHTPCGITTPRSQRMLERTRRIWVLLRGGFGEGPRNLRLALD